MLFQRLSAFSPISHYNHLNTKSTTTFQIQTQTETNYSPLTTNLVGGAGNYGSNVNKNNGEILLHQGQYNNLRSGFGSNNTALHGNVNILLGGAMLSVVISILCIACYCCHRNIKKRTESAYRQRWLENDDNMEIYSVEQCYESSGLFMSSTDQIPTLSHEPPPPYDAVILNEIANRASPPPGYRSTNSIDNTNENLPEISIRKQYNYDDEYPRQQINRMLRTSQSVCSLERAHNHRIQIDEINSIDTSSSSDQNSFYSNNNNNNNYNLVNQQQCITNNSVNGTVYSKLKSNSSSNDSDLDVLVNAIQQNQQLQNNSSITIYNLDISPISLSVPSTSSNFRQNNNEIENNLQIENGNEENIQNNLMDLLIYDEESDRNNNNNAENLSMVTNLSENNNNNCITENNVNNSNNNNDNNCNLNLESFNENGIVRLDMSQIIDTTGLPTYEAALKLESSGYV